MKRITACAVLLLLAFTAPASAAPAFDHKGKVLFGSVDPIPRYAYATNPSTNQIFEDVFALPTNPTTWHYTLKRTSGLTGLENLDLSFSSDLSAGSCAPPDAHEPDPSTETGTVAECGGAPSKWAIVFIDLARAGSVGANVTFDFSLS